MVTGGPDARDAWMAAVRDHPRRPPAAQCQVLYSLAARVDWPAGSGRASAGDLAGDAKCDERTVRRATGWGAAGRAARPVAARAPPRRRAYGVIRVAAVRASTGQEGASTGQEGASTGQGRHVNRTEPSGRLASWSAETLAGRLGRLKRDGPCSQRASSQGEHDDRIELYARMLGEGLWTADEKQRAVGAENRLWKRSRG